MLDQYSIKTLDHVSIRLTNVVRRVTNTLKTLETLKTVSMTIPGASSFEEGTFQYSTEVFYIV